MMAEATSAKRIDVVFDVYQNNSIENIERLENRSATTDLRFITFLTSEWRKENYRANFQYKEIFLAWDKECWKVISAGSTKIDSLSTTEEEADTRMFLHLRMEELKGYQIVVITSEDTDVFVLAVYVASVSNITIYQKRGTSARSRFVNISVISNAVGSGWSKCLPGFHAYTGCDTVNAFAEKGRLKSWKLLQKEEKYQEAFSTLGTEEKISSLFSY